MHIKKCHNHKKYLVSTVSASYLENTGLSCKGCLTFYKTACSYKLDNREINFTYNLTITCIEAGL
jgi:hypothetical protein